MAISVSPDDGSGGRMSYLRFDDKADGVHVVFVDVTGAAPPARRQRSTTTSPLPRSTVAAST
ncbi:MAG TPA: hypothetical protein VEG38_18655 [Acidimicrobiia bacterium]|nr:hypothetical protein [Acidimicrobiia bacterium]